MERRRSSFLIQIGLLLLLYCGLLLLKNGLLLIVKRPSCGRRVRDGQELSWNSAKRQGAASNSKKSRGENTREPGDGKMLQIADLAAAPDSLRPTVLESTDTAAAAAAAAAPRAERPAPPAEPQQRRAACTLH